MTNNHPHFQTINGAIIEENKAGPHINFNFKMPSLFNNHPMFFTAIASLSYLAIIFSISHKIFIHSINLEALIAAEMTTTSTGAILGEKTPEQADIDKLAENLLQLSPLTYDAFTLTFNYRVNAFVVKPNNNNPNYQSSFINWLNNSEYRHLPASYFSFSQ